MHSNEDNTKKYVEKVALVITSVSVRKLLNGLFQLRNPVCEIEIFKCLDDSYQLIKNEENNLIKNNTIYISKYKCHLKYKKRIEGNLENNLESHEKEEDIV